MSKRRLSVVTLSMALLLPGCTILGSATGPLPSEGGTGYSLPKARLNVTLTEASGNLTLAVSQPEYVADDTATYLLQYKGSPLSDDTVEVTVNPKTSLIESINATADDKTSEIIIELAKAAAMIAQAERGEQTVLLEREIDPAVDAEVQQLVADMNMVATQHAEYMFQRSKCVTAPSDTCTTYDEVRKGPNIKFVVNKPAPLAAEPADCSDGVCYRVPAPYGIQFSFNDRYSYGTVVDLPNQRPAIVLPLDRTTFVRRVNNAEFEDGMLKKVHIEKPSEGLEVASLPVRVMTAVFESVSNLIQAKIDISDKEKGLAEAETQRLQAEQQLKEQMLAMQKQAAAIVDPFLIVGSSNGLRKESALPQIVTPPPAAPASPATPSTPPSTAPSTPGDLSSPSSPGTNP